MWVHQVFGTRNNLRYDLLKSHDISRGMGNDQEKALEE